MMMRPAPSEERTLTVNPRGIVTQSAGGQDEVAWSGVRDIRATSGHLFILSKNRCGFAIPARVFRDAHERDACVAFCRAQLDGSRRHLSPMPAGTYGRRDESLIAPVRVPLDDEIARVCREFSQTDAAQREPFRDRISVDEFYTLLRFSHRLAVIGLREQRADDIRLAMVACAAIDRSLSLIPDYPVPSCLTSWRSYSR